MVKANGLINLTVDKRHCQRQVGVWVALGEIAGSP
jgi:hypothetical protein